MDFNLGELLTDLDESVEFELDSMPSVIDRGGSLDISSLPAPESRTWHRVDDAVAVVGDLKGSTRLGLTQRASSTASIYEAATGGLVKVLNTLGADFISIQGDGAFGLFWGEGRYERALCAGISVKTYSERHLLPRLEKQWPQDEDIKATGFKVGIANGPLLAKRIGIRRRMDVQEPVWAGRAVNYAAKAAQQAERHELIITGPVWDAIRSNQFLTYSCDCKDQPSDTLWTECTIKKIPDHRDDHEGWMLTAPWCRVHGDEFASSVLRGETKRSRVEKALLAKSLKDLKDRRTGDRRARKLGLKKL